MFRPSIDENEAKARRWPRLMPGVSDDGGAERVVVVHTNPGIAFSDAFDCLEFAGCF